MSTFTFFEAGDTVDSIDRVFTTAWSDNTNDLGASHFSSSTQYNTSSPTSSGAFFQEVYHLDPSNDAAEVQYSIAYGHRVGSGSENFDNAAGGEGFSATRSVYGQYRNLVFGGDETQNFSFDGHVSDGIYIINVNRARYKHALRMGNLSLHLGSTPIKLTDDSVTTSGSANAIRAGVGREFNIVSGSDGIRVGSSNTYVTDSGSYGYAYPDAGFIILNGDALDAAVADGGINLQSTQGNNETPTNPNLLREAIKDGGEFILDGQEDIASKFYFVRAKNTDFNYTTNDSFTENDGTLKFDSMIDNPETYITTVGLYNDNQDLLAVAKMSQPLPKDFTKEALIKVKLDY
jgi:hypothetical protein